MIRQSIVLELQFFKSNPGSHTIPLVAPPRDSPKYSVHSGNPPICLAVLLDSIVCQCIGTVHFLMSVHLYYGCSYYYCQSTYTTSHLADKSFICYAQVPSPWLSHRSFPWGNRLLRAPVCLYVYLSSVCLSVCLSGRLFLPHGESFTCFFHLLLSLSPVCSACSPL